MPTINALMVAFLTGETTPSTFEVFVEAVGLILEEVTAWFGTILNALLNTDGALFVLFPFVAIGFALGLVHGGIRLVKTFVPGF